MKTRSYTFMFFQKVAVMNLLSKHMIDCHFIMGNAIKYKIPDCKQEKIK